jgi:peptide deformylase
MILPGILLLALLHGAAALVVCPAPLSATAPRLVHRRALPLLLAARADEVNPGAVPGTALRVLEYPHPLLRAPNEEVVDFANDALRGLTKQMFAIMYASRGVGLAAPQLGVNKRLMVFNPEGDSRKWMAEVVLCNPRIVEFSSTAALDEEGCLSFPGFTADVRRSSWIKVEYQNLKGKLLRKKYAGWEARIFQHEYDHLDGVLYVDRLSEAERKRVQPELDALVGKLEPELEPAL